MPISRTSLLGECGLKRRWNSIMNDFCSEIFDCIIHTSRNLEFPMYASCFTLAVASHSENDSRSRCGPPLGAAGSPGSRPAQCHRPELAQGHDSGARQSTPTATTMPRALAQVLARRSKPFMPTGACRALGRRTEGPSRPATVVVIKWFGYLTSNQ